MLSRYLFMVGKGITFHEEKKQQTTTIAPALVVGNQTASKKTFPTTGISATTMLTSVLNPPLTLHTQFGCPPNIAIDCQPSLLSDNDQQVSYFISVIVRKPIKDDFE